MVDTLKLKGLIVESGMTQVEIAKRMGMTNRMWYERMNKRKFNSDEIYQLIRILEIDNPAPIFFADKVTQ